MIEVLVILNIALQLGDGYTTILCERLGGYEENNSLRALREYLREHTHARWAWLAIGKGIGVLANLALWGLHRWMQPFEHLFVVGLLLMAGYYVVLIRNNFKVYQRLKEQKNA